jgi:hypothetical protein
MHNSFHDPATSSVGQNCPNILCLGNFLLAGSRWRTGFKAGRLSGLGSNVGALAQILIEGSFICVLKTSPETDVIDQGGIEVYLSTLNINQELLERISPRES